MSALALDYADVSFTPESTKRALRPYIDGAIELFGRDDLEISMEFDLGEWARIIASAPRTDGRNPAFTPGESPPPDDAYWLRITHRDGRLAAIMAARFIDTELGFYEHVRAGRLWFPEQRPLPVIPLHPGPRGALAHTGGLWVSPDADFAGIGISWLLTRLNHAIAMARWDLDWVIGVVFQKLVQKGVAANYGAESMELMLDAPLGPNGARMIMYALPNSREFVVRRSFADLLQMRNEKNKKMRDFAPFAKGKYQSTKAGVEAR